MISALYKLIDFSFNGEEPKFITISKFEACWSKESICFNKQKMKDII